MSLLLKALLHLRANGPFDTEMGICGFVHDYFEIVTERNAAEKEFYKLVITWKYYTGNVTFPIPYNKRTRPDKTPANAFWETENLWNKRSPYGRLRWELIDFLIAKLQ